MRGESFGGASVTIPHKETIIKIIDEVRGAAIDIGAVNTIVVENNNSNNNIDNKLVGYNTDWIGIQRPILRKLIKQKSSQNNNNNNNKSRFNYSGYGLVVGAGIIITIIMILLLPLLLC